MKQEKDIVQAQQYLAIQLWEYVKIADIEKALEYVNTFDYTTIADLTQEEITKYHKDIKNSIRKSYVDGEGYRFYLYVRRVCSINRTLNKKLLKQNRIEKSWVK